MGIPYLGVPKAFLDEAIRQSVNSLLQNHILFLIISKGGSLRARFCICNLFYRLQTESINLARSLTVELLLSPA